LNLRPLGYEQYDARLRRSGRSQFVALTSAGKLLSLASGSAASPLFQPVPPRPVHRLVHKARPNSAGRDCDRTQ